METAPDLAPVKWVKSSHSGGNDGNCIEFSRALAPSGIVPIRDSKGPEGPALAVSAPSWSAFVDAVKGGNFPAL
jgi:hypothetical protein